MILVADDEGVYLDANPAATELLGYEHDELIGMTIAEISEVDAGEFREAWEGFKRAGRAQGEYRLRTKGGEWRDVEFRAVANVLPGHHLSTLRDVTERKRLDAALQESERRVRQLARDVTLAEQQERRRIAHVLHEDLQQRLVAARMVGSLHPGEVPSPERVADLQRMLNDAIATSRRLSHELSPPILRGTALNELLYVLSEQARKEFQLDVHVDVDPSAKVSKESLRVLLYHLVRELFLNVVKHAGTERVILSGEIEGGTLRICVSDSGQGFDPEDLGRTDRTGMGLPMARERIELLGGRLVIDASPGHGTRVVIEIPDTVGA